MSGEEVAAEASLRFEVPCVVKKRTSPKFELNEELKLAIQRIIKEFQAEDDVNRSRDSASQSGSAKDSAQPEIEFTVLLRKKSRTDKLGADVARVQNGLVILRVTQGLISDFNVDNPDNKIQPVDYILAVNGVADDPSKIMQEIMSRTELEVRVCRYLVDLNQIQRPR